MTLAPWMTVLRDHAKREISGRRWANPGEMTFALDAKHQQSPALDAIDRELVALADDAINKLMVFMPPQEGKSQKIARRFPAWLLYGDPTLRIIIVSFDDKRALRWGRDIKRDVEQHPILAERIRLRSDSRSAGKWETEQGGGVYCAGIASGITGEPADVIIIDDPVKGRAEAESPTYRQAAWDTWESTILPRLSGRAKVVLVMTRWHHDDLAGRLLDAEPGEWRVLSMPAVAEANDPLGRKPGAEFPSVRGRLPGYFRKLAAKLTPYVWLGLFQQRPSAAGGNVFKRDDARFWRPGLQGPQRFLLEDHAGEVDLRDCMRFITIDLATSVKTSADWTVAAAWAVGPSGDLILLDRVRERVDKTGHWDLVTPLRSRWLSDGDVVHVESRMFGTTFVYEAGRAGIPIRELDADADKLTRAIPAASRWHAHTVHIPAEAPWLDEWLEELAEFPNAAHDDQVDVFAYAARVAATEWITPDPAAELLARRRSNELDIMRVQY